MTNTNKDFRKPEIKKDDNIGKAIQQYQEQKQQEVGNRKDKVVKLGNRKFTIKRWSNIEALRKLPTVANLLFVPAAAPMAEAIDFSGEEAEMVPELFSAADMMTVLFDRFQQVHFAEFIIDLLDEVYIYGQETPIDVEKDLDLLEIVPVVVEVLQANFMMQLCRDLLGMTPQILQAQEINLAMQASHQTSNEQ
uniref:Tail assembly chaperone n=1 Tax=Vibrio phage P018-4 TaxID=3229728 RepID=A0AB39AJ69_9CAUD